MFSLAFEKAKDAQQSNMASGGFSFGTPVAAATSSNPSLFNATPTQAAISLDTAVSSTEKESKKTPKCKFGQRTSVKKAVHKFSEEERFFTKLQTPWRRVEWTEDERSSLLEKVSSYTPSCRDVPQANVLLLGPVGSGKSSFISSVQSVFDGRVTNRAMVGHCCSSTSFTKKLQSFPLCGQDSATALVLYDMMGFGDGDMRGPTLHHILTVIKGHAPEGHKFSPDEALSSDTEGYIKRPSLKDQMHCVAFVLDASKVQYGSYSKGIGVTFQQLREHISDLGVHQVVLLTHVDKICMETAKDTSEVYKSHFIRETISKAADLLGMSPSYVVPVKNYWCELELEVSSDVLLLKAVDHFLQYTELFFRENAHKPAQARGLKVPL